MILTLLMYVVPVILLFRRFESYRIKNLDLSIENKIRVLRNNLRISAADDRYIKKDVGFSKIDSVIAQSEKSLKCMNMWVLLLDLYLDRKKHKNSGSAPIMFGGNEQLKKFYIEYKTLAIDYMFEKNLFFLLFQVLLKIGARKISRRFTVFYASLRMDMSNIMLSRQMTSYQ